MVPFPKGCELPNLQAGVCVCWELMNLQKMQVSIHKMGYHVNYIVPATHKRSYRPAHGQPNAPKTSSLTLVLFSSTPGQRYTWFNQMTLVENKEVILTYVVSSLVYFKFENSNSFFSRFLLCQLWKKQKFVVPTKCHLLYQYLFGKNYTRYFFLF
jgi:hypothetical protein